MIWKMFKQISKVLLIFLVIAFLINFIFEKTYSYPSKINYGITFSPRYANYLKLDYKKTYIQILDDLKVKNLRIPTYWDILEAKENQYDFTETDFMLNEANKRGARVILVVGARQPRWPECHIPDWARKLSLANRQQKILGFVQETVERYKNHSEIWAWQVENEPLLPFFGEGCDKGNEYFLKTEINLVKNLSNKTIIVSDAGELGSWIVPMQVSDVFGTTLYRKVYDKSLGYITYPIAPYLYNIKSNLVRNIFARNNQKTIIVEFQAEPWFADGSFIPPEQQAKILTKEDLKNYINFSKKTGFDEIYFWGVEWWYYMAGRGHPEYLDYAKTLFSR